MSKTWWAVIAGCLAGALALTGMGFLFFGNWGFLENLVAEAIGVLVGLAVIIWLVEGRVLTRQQRVRETLRYRREISQAVWDFTHIVAREIAEPIAGDFEPEIDLYGHERANWPEFKPLLREIFRCAMDVPEQGLPPQPSLNEEHALRYMEGALVGVERIQQKIDKTPNFDSDDILGSLVFDLELLSSHATDAVERNLLSNPVSRYAEVGQLGDLVLRLSESLDMLPSNTDVW